MKKITLILAAIIILIGIPALSYPESKKTVSNKIFGKVLKAEGVFILVMDKEGRTHKFHLDETTRLNGKIKAGMAVVIESSDSGHAVSISTNDPQK
ncbi:MAG: hypothetical protein ABGX83_02680 [Nitrospira sp.]|nr:hypothetical protein [Candidatus Manganitrophaceae bacterium]HIL34871.1 hypothetical protein [Candidatus Manganitrophaceae bacterium]